MSASARGPCARAAARLRVEVRHRAAERDRGHVEISVGRSQWECVSRRRAKRVRGRAPGLVAGQSPGDGGERERSKSSAAKRGARTHAVQLLRVKSRGARGGGAALRERSVQLLTFRRRPARRRRISTRWRRRSTRQRRSARPTRARRSPPHSSSAGAAVRLRAAPGPPRTGETCTPCPRGGGARRASPYWPRAAVRGASCG